MHLAFLTPEYPHPHSTPSGGLGTSIKNLVEQLVKRRIRITIFVYGQEKDLVFDENGISFHFIRQLQYNFFTWYRYRKHLEFYINKVSQEEQIDALEAPDWTGITAFMKLKCPLVIRMHGSDSYFCRLEGRKQKKKNFWFEKHALKSSNHLLSVSKFTAGKTGEIFNLKKAILVIPNLVDIDVFKPTGEIPERDTILYFGSIIRKKGVLELAHIFKQVNKQNPNTRLIMAGRDVLDIQTQRSTRSLFEEILPDVSKEKVLFTGSLPYEEIRFLISQADVIVLPSFAEALPMTWLEAMAMEKALVTSDIGWAKEIMTDGVTGYTVNPKNHSHYSEKILELLNNHELSAKMGKEARKQVIKKFSTKVIVEKNIRFYKKIITN